MRVKRNWAGVLLFGLLLALPTAGCSGGKMLKKGQPAPKLTEGAGGPVRAIDGSVVTLAELSKKGAVVLVLLRGFS